MHLYKDINDEIISWMKAKRDPASDPAVCETLINVFKSVKAKGESIAKDRKISEVTTDIMFEAILKEMKELKQTLSTVPEDSPLHLNASLQYKALDKYAPRKLSIERLTSEIKSDLESMTFVNFGEAMKYFREKFKFTSDGQTISNLLKDLGNFNKK